MVQSLKYVALLSNSGYSIYCRQDDLMLFLDVMLSKLESGRNIFVMCHYRGLLRQITE